MLTRLLYDFMNIERFSKNEFSCKLYAKTKLVKIYFIVTKRIFTNVVEMNFLCQCTV